MEIIQQMILVNAAHLKIKQRRDEIVPNLVDVKDFNNVG